MPNAREQLVEALYLDPDYRDPDEHPFEDLVTYVRELSDAMVSITNALAMPHDDHMAAADVVDEVKRRLSGADPGGEAAKALCRIADALGLANDPDLTPADVARAVEQLAADARDPKRDEAFIWRVADKLELARETATGSYLIRQIDKVIRERSTFRDALDKAFVPLVKRARKLQVEDYLQNERGDLWTVTKVEPDAFGVTVDLRSCRTGREVRGKRIDHPDEPVTVLTPLVVRDGLLLLRKELGAQLVDYEPGPTEPAAG